MNKIQNEIMLIAQEECAEVTQAISKVFRFGLESVHKERSNREHLEEEIGDLLCMIDLINEHGIVDWSKVEAARGNKRLKLKQWSIIR
jgi:NTP pyrophosphatase (non-canonical NTP hydrolase)